MGAVAEDKTTNHAKGSRRLLADGRSNKVVKKSKEKKSLKGLDTDAIVDAVENPSPESEDTQDNREKRAQGIIIDGRTYTCATCKTGHRVGICKHAKERPMTATHPPGRPPAGAPKKVICDCPKQCKCKKKDCKCARNCVCTQKMYMLVYVPAPNGEENADEEKGTWKLGKPVTTDLKGNILTPEEIQKRLEQKEAQKVQSPDKRGGNVTAELLDDPVHPTSYANTDAISQADGGCCKHKENVSSRAIAIEASPQSGRVSKSAADGCNCGHTCDCAFCPQHPNNSTSIDMARQQAMHFANQPVTGNYQPVVSFMPTIPQGPSCMGGVPRFAISRYSEMPSSYDIQRAFPNPGYVIGYPVWSTRTDSSGCSVAPFPTSARFMPEMRTMQSEGLDDLESSIQTPLISSAQLQLPSINFSSHEFGIGNAFVASAGPGGWTPHALDPHAWSAENAIATPIDGSYLNLPEFPSHSLEHGASQTTPISINESYDFSDVHVNNENTPFDFTSLDSTTQLQEIFQQPDQPKSCCAAPTLSESNDDVHIFVDNCFSPKSEYTSPIVIHPHS